mgnify:CR=1 FL=1
MTDTFVRETRQRFGVATQAACLALTMGLALVAAPRGADAAQVKIVSITAAPGASDGFLPDDRLGLVGHTVGDNVVTHTINKADCEAILAAASATVRITWNWSDYATLALTAATSGVGSGTAAPHYAIKMATPTNTCSISEFKETDASVDKCSIIAAERKFTSIATTDELFDLNLKTLMGSPANCNGNVDGTATVYFILDDAGLGITIGGVALEFDIDTKAPDAPTINAVSAGNQNLKVTWTTVDEATTKYSRVYWSKVSFPATAPTQATSWSGLQEDSSYQITGLTNGETYFVAVTSIDEFDNESVAAKVVQASPVPVQDLWQSYKANGGASEGGYYGCSAGRPAPRGAGPDRSAPWWILLAAGALLLLRRRKTAVAAALLIACATIAAPQQSFAESPRTMSLDIQAGYYTPMIDREFSKTTGATPYADMMTTPAMLYGAALDWRLLHGIGELAVGFSVGYWSQTGKALRYDSTDSDDEVELLVVPVTLDLIYRFNWLAEKFSFPLVPYVKGGLAYGFWWASDGTGETSTYTDANNKVFTGSGGVAGLHGTIGMRLLLDVFEPKAARGFDIEMGVNHSYLYIEYSRLALTNFGDAKALDLSDDVVILGLAFDL